MNNKPATRRSQQAACNHTVVDFPNNRTSSGNVSASGSCDSSRKQVADNLANKKIGLSESGEVCAGKEPNQPSGQPSGQQAAPTSCNNEPTASPANSDKCERKCPSWPHRLWPTLIGNNKQQASPASLTIETGGCGLAPSSRTPDANRLPDKVDEMTKKKRYYICLLCLCLFMIAALLASFVISRSVGDDLEAENSSRNSGDKNERLVDQMELRSIDLVDLIECDKTFAYTKWRLQVRVPKSTPIYKQQAAGNQVASSKAKQSRQQVDTGLETGGQRVPPVPKVVTLSAVDADASEQADNPAEYILTSTRQFVADANEPSDGVANDANSRAPTDQMPVSSSKQTRRRSIETTAGWPGQDGPNESEVSSIVARVSLDRDGQQSDMNFPIALNKDDPIRVAANSLDIETKSFINSTVIDCFIVDIDKRLNQKLSIAQKFKSLASTRTVDFGRMLAIIKACRMLSWSTLTKQLKNEHHELKTSSRVAASTNSSVEKINVLGHPEGGVELDEIVVSSSNDNRTNSNVLNEFIRPIESKRTTNVDATDYFGSLLGVLLMGGSDVGGEQEPAGAPSELAARERLPDAVTAPGSRREAAKALSALSPELARQRALTRSPLQDEQLNRGSYLNMGVSMINGIVPNTLWCGLGDRAANYSELGAEFLVDSCCRAHDHCPIRLRPFAADYGLINWSVSTRSHCDCDLDFSDCLSTINSTLSNVIKTLYFRFVGLQCIDLQGKLVPKIER